MQICDNIILMLSILIHRTGNSLGFAYVSQEWDVAGQLIHAAC